MFKKILFISGLFACIHANAQITVTSADMPNANDSIVLSTADLAGVSLPIAIGTNMNWDYSALVPTIQRYDKYDSPTTFTSPFNLLFSPLNCSYGRDNYALTTLPIPGIQLTDAYDFLRESTTSYRQVGAGYTFNGAPIPFFYTQQDVIYKFPMHYGNMDTSNFKFGLPIPSLAYYGQTGTRQNNVNGWGDITTPFGTFQALLVTSQIDVIDTVYVDALGFGFNINRPTKYEYKWLANGKKIPVLQIDANQIGGNLVVSNVQFLDSLRSNVPHIGINESDLPITNISIYPNPSNSQINLSYTLSTTENVVISIVDILGKEVLKVVNEKQMLGDHKKLINISNLDAGAYFIQLNTN
ncbi:MAG: T9SS type A sorting domain-containing protein, partial [Bacteroidia bacterium]|nr:T9SS type A sorting domain-containing protein [Bacteroidia bacterium]